MLSPPITLLTAAIAVVGANSMVLAPITGAVAADLGGDPADIVQAAAAYGVTTAISAILLAPRADVIGAHRALYHAVLIVLASMIASVVAPTKWALTLAQGVGGIGAGMAIPAIYALAPQLGPKGQEKRSMGLVLSGWTLALVAGVAGSGFLAEFAGWRAVYAVLAVAIIGVFIAMHRIDLTVDLSSARPTSPLTALRVPGIWRGLFAAGALMLGFYGTYAFIGAHVHDALGRGPDWAGVVTLFYGTGFGLAALIDKYVDRLPQSQAGALSFAGLTAVYLAQLAFGGIFVALTLIALCWGIVQHLGLNFVVSRLASLDVSQRGAVLGLNSAVTYLAVTGGALAFRPAYEYGGLALCNLLSALCVAAAVAESLTAPRADHSAA
ncbi:multidrug-efflux transporter-like protein [Pseudooceanicola batsensis HTCC2597]|uniref:Multidrug-efflux transporter-like protein n=1 Tax=Pseudooceanicola batsensis (strain ATCC BAA-863 / DSM 15984 / KCTC 12145 / HTCC2597) TaxID=252305 RepID=A3TX74_PSEBH|nr:MFS transporter [Pseudooceanicola batsensis]EAQ03434.1 multidrug-efflux transporter-like protein [Pseudooceanicola batsensis HTCC2597]